MWLLEKVPFLSVNKMPKESTKKLFAQKIENPELILRIKYLLTKEFVRIEMFLVTKRPF